MYQEPNKSPWGAVQTCDTLCPGVFLVSTASHGGTMVSNDVAAFLSPAAKRCGFRRGGYLCFEEDTQEEVVLRELLDKKLWKIPERIKTGPPLRKISTALSSGTIPSIGGPDSRALRRCGPPERRQRPARQNDDLGPSWPEAPRR